MVARRHPRVAHAAGGPSGWAGPFGSSATTWAVPRFEPFPGIRYREDEVDLAEVTAPPYDVISPSDRSALAARHPHNVVAVDLPVDGEDPYAEAAATLDRWREEGVLVADEPSFYIYRMDFRDERGTARHTTGVLGALELSRPGEGGILPHEHTTPKAKSDRLNLLRSTRANLSAVWGLSPASGLTALLDTDDPPAASWTADDVTHSYWIVRDPGRIDKISDTVASSPVVIADGHHRFETSLAYRDERRAADAEQAGTGSAAARAYDAVLTYVVELAEDQLSVLPIHRLVTGLPDGFDLGAELDPFFVVTPASTVDAGITRLMRDQGCLVLVRPEGNSLLTPRPEAFAGLRALDTVRLDAALAALPEHELVFQHGVENVVRAVERGDAQAGVLLRPATVRQIISIAHGGERMPPKTTFFHPKPRTGVVFRSLDDPAPEPRRARRPRR
jgi:uncharacterized protein (DUF1015 family)